MSCTKVLKYGQSVVVRVAESGLDDTRKEENMDRQKFKTVALPVESHQKLSAMSKEKFEIPVSMARMVRFFIDNEYEKFVVDRTGLTSKELPSLAKPKSVRETRIPVVSEDEVKKGVINGTLDDPKLETTLFPNGRPRE